MSRLLLLLLVILVFIPLGVSAQEAITIEVLEVEFWPEYDQPEMLVIYHIELSSDTQFPANLSIRIPAAAGNPFVLFVDGFGEPEYQQRIEGDWSVISFTSSGPVVRLEYYDPSLTKDGDRRSFTYTWPGDYPVNSFGIIAQRPFDATSFITTPTLSNQVPGTNGLSYHQESFGSLNAGEQPSVTVKYEKPSDILSIDKPDTSGFVDEVSPDIDWLVVLLAAVGVGLVGYGVYSYTQSTSGRGRKRSARRRKRPAGGTKGSVFCHHCGAQAQKGDQFCRECGQKLRV